jgi:hypothetical protein
LGIDSFLFFFIKKNNDTGVYGFRQSKDQDFLVMYAPYFHTNSDNIELALEQSTLVDFKENDNWPVKVWQFEQIAYHLAPPVLIKDHERSHYDIDIWQTTGMDYMLECYNRMGRVMMLLVLSFVPLLLVEAVSLRKRMFILVKALAWYVLFWFVFILSRWVLMWDQFSHVAWIFFPHLLMLTLIGGYYWFLVRK